MPLDPELARYSRRDFEVAERVIGGDTLQTLANELGVTRQRVMQIVKKVLLGTAHQFGNDEYLVGDRAYRKNPTITALLVRQFRVTRLDALI